MKNVEEGLKLLEKNLNDVKNINELFDNIKKISLFNEEQIDVNKKLTEEFSLASSKFKETNDDFIKRFDTINKMEKSINDLNNNIEKVDRSLKDLTENINKTEKLINEQNQLQEKRFNTQFIFLISIAILTIVNIIVLVTR